MSEYIEILKREDVTDEVLAVVEHVYDGWFTDGRINWDDFLERMDGSVLESGEKIDMGPELDSPAIRKIKAHVRKLRRGEA